MDSKELSELVRQVRELEAAMGDGRKKPAPEEAAPRQFKRRGIYTARAIAAGETIERKDVHFKAPSNKQSTMALWHRIEGSTVKQELEEGILVTLGEVWGVSMGHAMRSGILARKIAPEYEVTYLMKAYEDGQDYVRDQGFRVVSISIDDDSDETVIKACKEIQPELLICDLIKTPYTELFDYCRAVDIRTIVFDTKGFL
ncbi:hypothetical protein ADUPG1_003637, partial [Aduncisulcus paluster]